MCSVIVFLCLLSGFEVKARGQGRRSKPRAYCCKMYLAFQLARRWLIVVVGCKANYSKKCYD